MSGRGRTTRVTGATKSANMSVSTPLLWRTAELERAGDGRPPLGRAPRGGVRAGVAARRRLVDGERDRAVRDQAGLGLLAEDVGEEAVDEPFAARGDRG